MDLSNFEMKDLTTKEKLNEFLQAVEDRLKNLKYGDLKKIVETITNEIQGKVINVSEGRESIDTGNVLIEDIMKVAVELSNSVQNDIRNHKGLSTTAISEREDLVKSMDNILSGLFEQSKLQEELIKRGFSKEDFIAQVDAANERSKEKIKDAKAEKRKMEFDVEGFLGRDSIISTGVYMQKSVWTQICDYKEAVTMFSVAKEQFEILNQLKAKGTLTPEDEKRAKNIENNLKYLADGIMDLNIKGFDNKIFEDWTEDAKRAGISTEIDKKLSELDNERNNIYDELKNKIPSLTNEFKAKYRVSELETALGEFEKASSKEDKDKARKKIDNYLMQINAEIKMEPEKTIRAEKDLISIRNNGVEEVIKELDSQENDNSDVTFLTENDGHGNVGYKTTWIQMMDEFGCGVYEDKMEPERDAKGDIVYEDPQKTKPKMVPVPERNEKGEIVTDDDGNIVYEKDPEKPHMIEVYETEEITDEDTINKYLQTFAESKAAYIIQENINMLTDPRKLYSSKEEYKQSKASAKRLLQDYKIGNKFTRFFAPKLLLKKHKENIVKKILDDIKKDYVKMMITKDVVEGKFNKDSVEKQMEEVKGRAAMHHRLFEAGQAQAHRADKNKDAFDRERFISGMQDASYEALAVKKSKRGKIDKDSEKKIISDNTYGADMPTKSKTMMHVDKDNGDR